MSNGRIPKKANNKIGEYSLQTKFVGYNARQDPTTLTPNTLVSPSQNVLVGTSGRIKQVEGYTLDGQSSSVIDSGILSNYDFHNFKGSTRNLRAGFMTGAANDGKLQFRYKDSSANVTWINLLTGLTSINLVFCDFWDNANLIKLCLWVDGSSNVYSWTGAVTTIAGTSSTTVSKQGSSTWQQEGFSSTGSISIGGIDYTYTGGYDTTTLTGLTAVPVISVGTEVHQTPVITALSGMTAPTGFTEFNTNFFPDVIGCGRRNQVYLGSSSSNNLCISKTNSFTDYSFTTPVRVVGEGALIPLDSPPTAFIPQEVTANDGGTNAYDMWISEGLSTWAVIRATLSTDLTKETLEHIRLKVGPRQGAVSTKMVTKMKNHILVVDNNNVANFIGYISYEYVPTIVDFSYPIINDMKSYDPTDGCTFYHDNYNYIAFPKEGLVRVYNMTDQTKDSFSQYKAIEDVTQMPWFWESPITYPISGFYVTDDGEFGGHGYDASESYFLFNGGSFNGQNIHANATFAFDDLGDRTQSKGSNEIWADGYIKQNTEITTLVAGDLDGCQSGQTVIIDGNNTSYVCSGVGGGDSLGDAPLGTHPLGGSRTLASTILPSYFHVVKTYVQQSYYLEQISFDTNGIDLQWEIISFGTNKTFTAEGNNSITD